MNRRMKRDAEAAVIVERLTAEYDSAVDALKAALKAFMTHGVAPDPALRAKGAFAYPELRLTYTPSGPPPRLARSYARFSQPGVYATTITRPRLFRDYLTEQLALLMADFEVEAEVGRSTQEIPFPYVLDGSADIELADVTATEIARHFPTTHPPFTGDAGAAGFWDPPLAAMRPLSLFAARRTA